MLTIRLYITALTLLFLVVVITTRGFGILAAIVITSALIYLILDTRDELKLRKLELQYMQLLEQHISTRLR